MLDYTMKRLDGQEQSLSEYRGKVLLLVNVASQCGLTPQYTGLQELYTKYKDQGLEILGFPANNFGAQEPGTDQQIAQFCETSYGVSFPMFSKISVKGADRHPLYAELTTMPTPIGGEVEWNFQKYLVDRSGQVVARFAPPTAPGDPALVSKVEELLAEPPN
ncbi:MAG: glutathione peroxidase [Chloroflexota bacterium]